MGDPLEYLRTRITAKGMAYYVGSAVALFAPVIIWARRSRLRPDVVLLLLVLPPLAIRFFGKAWGHQYTAVLVAGAVMSLTPLFIGNAVPRWVFAATAVLVVAVNGPAIKAVRYTLIPSLAAKRPAMCPEIPQRLASIDRGVAAVRATPGAALVGGNLLPALADRGDVYQIGGPAPGSAFAVVFTEKPPFGDPWPLTRERIDALLSSWRTSPGATVWIDDDWVFVAQGSFEQSR